MINQLARFIVVLAAVAVTGCSSTSILSSEKAEGEGPINLQGKQVVALVVHDDAEIRATAEDALAKSLTKRGMIGIAAHTFLSSELITDKAKAKEAIKGSGAEGLVVVRVLDVEETTRYRSTATTPYQDDYYGSMMSYYAHGWSTVNSPGYLETIESYLIETVCYRVSDEKRLWAGTSKSINPASVKSLAKELVKEAGKVMKQQGLIAAKN